MEHTYYLAVDIGASSGRHILAHLENGKLQLEEVYRFPNGGTDKNGLLCWDHEGLFQNILAGMKKCKEIGKTPSFMGIDTWGVDYLLLDENDKVVGDSICYRDSRTEGMFEKVYEIIPEQELYERTGIQMAIHNTIYQLMAHKLYLPEQLQRAQSLLMMPDFLGFRLTGVKHQEYTNATTSQLINIETGTWDYEMIERLGFPARLFGPLSMPGTTVGKLLPQIAEQVGYDLTVLHPASHDTASAVLAVPTNSDNIAFLSSGTWSLMGFESLTPVYSEQSREMNFANEGGFNKRYRVLTNIMGLWLIQSVKKELKDQYSFSELSDMAREYENSAPTLDVDDPSFIMPKSMIGAIRAYCGKEDMCLGEVVASIYRGLAQRYAKAIRDITELTGKTPDALHIIGGGSKDSYLNELAARLCGIPVYTGPTEATSIGNILSQMLGQGVFASVAEARNCVFDSFEVKKVEIQ